MVMTAALMRFCALIVALLLTGCATSVVLEAEHVSHPTAGWPCEPQKLSEDDLTQASALLRWRRGHWYVDAGLGYKLQGRNGGGVWGPAVTGTVRVGREFSIGMAAK
jgi:hypothetical protein